MLITCYILPGASAVCHFCQVNPKQERTTHYNGIVQEHYWMLDMNQQIMLLLSDSVKLSPKVMLEIDNILSVMLTNRFQGDQSKTRLSVPFHIEVNLSVDLNHNFMFRLSLCLKL